MSLRDALATKQSSVRASFQIASPTFAMTRKSLRPEATSAASFTTGLTRWSKLRCRQFEQDGKSQQTRIAHRLPGRDANCRRNANAADYP
jgi:hypothetical protein